LVLAVTLIVAVGAVAVAMVVRNRETRSRLYKPDGNRRPNIVVIMTDDQTLESMRVMSTVNRVLGAEGTTFTSYYVSFPNCCPSRATFLTGQYSHNTGVEDNVPPLGGVQRLRADETLPVWLRRAGYYTAHVGKYLNGWGADGDIAPPPGWDRWFGLIDPTTYRYFGYSVSKDGQRVDFGDSESDYQTDVLANEVLDVIKDRAGGDRPFFVSFAPLAPHSERSEGSTSESAQGEGTEQPNGDNGSGQFHWSFAKPAPRHQQSLAARAPRTPSYDVAPDPASGLGDRPPLTENVQRLIDRSYQLELQSLQAVDEAVGRIVETLASTGQLDNTVIFYTSDNGLFHGQHRLPGAKYHLYEPAVHVPLVVRGGPFPKGKKVSQVAVNADLAPTIVALAGATAGVEMDGTDLAAVANDSRRQMDRAILLENKSRRGEVYAQAIHTARYVLIQHHTGAVELYDLDRDPDQLVNLADDPAAASLRQQLQRRLDALGACRGSSCVDFGRTE
jgi:arylsulfatase A-like enzyme